MGYILSIEQPGQGFWLGPGSTFIAETGAWTGTPPEATLYKPQREVLGYCYYQQPSSKHIVKA